MFDSPHPGLTLRDDVLPALGLAEQRLKVTPLNVQRAPADPAVVPTA